jgi:glycosyltransferase involved in cell wall biosynthesis
MSNTCEISVVMPCFNHGKFLPEAVASVTKAGRKDMELVVVDDGSTDEQTREAVGKLEQDGHKVIRQENKGLAAARNAGIAASCGEYILPLDADDRLRHEWIDRAIQILKANPQVGVVYGNAKCFGAREELWRTGAFDVDRLLHRNFIHATALYRRAVWEQNGGYDGMMPVQGWEDWDFWLGAFERGWQFAYLPEVFFEYRQSEGSMLVRGQQFESEVEAFIARKHGLLYREASQRLTRENDQLARDHESVKRTCRNLSRLLKSRIKQKFFAGRGGS